MFNIFKRSQHKKPYFLIALNDEVIQAAFWSLKGKKIKTDSLSKVKEYDDLDDAVKKTDEALQELGSKANKVHKTVYALEDSWLVSNNIHPQKKKFLKQLSEDLVLKPVGYVVITDALTQHVIDNYKTSNVLNLYLQADDIKSFFIKEEKVINEQVIKDSSDLVNDLKKVIIKTIKSTGENTVPQIINLASLSHSDHQLKLIIEQITNLNWNKNLSESQVPEFNVIKQDELSEIVTIQGGKEVIKTYFPQLKKKIDDAGSQEIENTKDEVEDQQSEQSIDEETPIKPTKKTKFNIFSRFFKKKSKDSEITQQQEDLTEEFKPTDLDIKEKKVNPKKIIFLGSCIGLISLIVIAAVYLYMTYQVNIKLFLNRKTINTDAQIYLNPEIEESDPENLILKAQLVEKEIKKSKTSSTTGTKTVGEKAKGKVKILNKTDHIKVFDEGTQLSDGELVFVLDDEVRVASASTEPNPETDGEIVEYGKKEVNITAADIGEESNIKKGTDLRVSSYDSDSYEAEVVEDLTGGTSEELQIVSKEDQENLIADCRKEALDDAKQQFEQDSGNGEYFFFTGDLVLEETKFDYEIGDEADMLALDLTATAKAVSYKSSDLIPLAKAALAEKIPDGYEFYEEEPEIMSQPGEEASDSAVVVLDANISARVKPKVEEQDWSSELMGKTTHQAINDFKGKNEFSNVEINLEPFFVSWLIDNIPKDPDRININFEY